MSFFQKHTLLCFLCAVVTMLKTVILAQQSPQSSHRYEGVIGKKASYRYLQYLPESYDQDGTKNWPLLLFLHGVGERGNDLEKVKMHGPPKLVESDPDFPFVLISPQCEEGKVWEVDPLLGLLDEVTHRLKIDSDRIYVTGLSMGGFGAWSMIAKEPGRFAAAIPICGGGNTGDFMRELILPSTAEALAKLPIWVFHGEKDTVVLPQESKRLVSFFQSRLKGNIRLTLYPEAGHDSWTKTYNNPELYQWLLKQSRGSH